MHVHETPPDNEDGAEESVPKGLHRVICSRKGLHSKGSGRSAV